jgi:hypothetical protein
MQLVRATDDDNEKLLHYFSQTSFPGPVRLRLRRMFHFFNQYRIQSDDYATYLLLNDKQEIEAMASLIFRDGFVEGQPAKIGYATDLRVSPTRRAILGWSQHFLPVLEAECQQRNCHHLFSVVAQSQRQAYNAFIRPRNLRRRMPRYHLFRRFQVVSLHGLWPLHAKPLPGIRVRTATEGDLPILADYILKKTADRPVRFYNTPDDFRKTLHRWRDLYLENFLLAFDSQDHLIGCTAPWSPERVQRLYPIHYGPKAQNLKDVLQLFSWMRVARPLPSIESEMEVRYLTHLYADNPDILYSLLFYAYQMAGKKESLLYSYFEGDLMMQPPQSFISAEVPFGFYSILSPNDPAPNFLKPSLRQPAPVFEPAFI